MAQETSQTTLSFSQQRLWMLDQFDKGSAQYNIFRAIHMHGELNVEALEGALRSVIDRQQCLRTCFVKGDLDEPILQLREASDFVLRVIDLAALDEAELDQEIERHIQTERKRCFDLSHELMLRASLLTLAEREHILLLTSHNIVADDYSIALLIKEFSQVYTHLVAGSEYSLKALPLQYSDYEQRLRNCLNDDVLAEHLQYWRTKLTDLPVVHNLPLEHPRPWQQSYNGALHKTIIPAESFKRLSDICQEKGASLFMGLHAVFSVLIARYSNESDIVIGTQVDDREQPDVADLIASLANTLVLRTDLSGDPSFLNVLEQCKNSTLEALSHKQLPFECLLDHMQPERSLSHSPMFQIMLVFQDNISPSPCMSGIQLTAIENHQCTAKYDLTLYAAETTEGLALRWEYNTDLFSAEGIERLARHFSILLNNMILEPQGSVYRAAMLSDEELHQQLVQWNDTREDFDGNIYLQQLFEEQVSQAPSNIALISDQEQLSYQELNIRANQLAHYLVAEHGLGRGQLAAIYLARSVDTIVSILAILKTGAAYLPIDVNNPDCRTKGVLQDADPSVVITYSKETVLAGQHKFALIELDNDDLRKELKLQPRNNLVETDQVPSVDDTAYVIFTSGSTGRPKGVCGNHRAMVNRILWMNRELPASVDEVFCQKTSLAFVDHVAEIFVPLSQARTMVILDDENVRDVNALLTHIARYRITRITIVPSLLKAMLSDATDLSLAQSLRCIFSSGEALTMGLAKLCRQYLPQARLYNLYGSTEVGADVTWYELSNAEMHVDIMQYFYSGEWASNDEGVNSTIDDEGLITKLDPVIRPGLGADLDTLSQQFGSSDIPFLPVSLSKYFEQLNEHVIPSMVDVSADTFIGHMTSKLPNFMPEISKIISSLNQNLVKVETSGGMSLIERQVLATMHRLFYQFAPDFYQKNMHDPAHVFGLVTSGGSSSNITALNYARNKALSDLGITREQMLAKGFWECLRLAGKKRCVFLGTRLMHYSMRKAMAIFGLGEDSLVFVDQDANMRMSVASLREKIQQCHENNDCIAAIIGIAGATETGTVDPLLEIAEVAQEYGIHFHVDAAWGGAFKFSERFQHKLAGIEKAGSITLCPHKQLYLPQGVSLCLFRDTETLGLIAIHANYQAQAGSFDMGQYTIEGSRPANALFLHAGLQVIAKSGYGWLVDQSMDKMAYFVKLIESCDCFKMIGPFPDLNIVNYIYVPPELRSHFSKSNGEFEFSLENTSKISSAVDLIQELQFKAGRTFVSKTTLAVEPGASQKVSVFRVVLSNPLTSFESLREVVLDQLNIVAENFHDSDAKRCSNDPVLTGNQHVDFAEYDSWAVPVGKPIANSRVYLLDRYLNPVPVGAIGELYVGGMCLAMEYLNNPELTAQKFISSPFSEGEQLYKTGDLMRWRRDGTLEYIGRDDQQVKIRGFRIELGEIEQALINHAKVEDAVVVANAERESLVAYVVSNNASHEALIGDLRHSLKVTLPSYMHPSAFVVLDELPFTPNGKLDRRALPDPDFEKTQARYIAPVSELEQRLCRLWQKLLKVQRVGIEDNFFHLGGNSLLLLKFVNEAREDNLNISAPMVMRAPCIRDIARQLA